MNFTDKTCEPTPTSKLIEKYGYERLKFLSPKERLQEINEIAFDWDGYRTVRGLGELLDEIRTICIMPYAKEEEEEKKEEEI